MSRSIKHPPAPDRFTKRNRTAGHAKAVKVEKVDAVSILFDLLDSSTMQRDTVGLSYGKRQVSNGTEAKAPATKPEQMSPEVERLKYLKSREVNAAGGTSLSDAEDAELAEMTGQFAPRDATKPEQMTPDEFTETMDIESSGITLTPAVKSHLKQLRDTASYVMRKSPQEAARMLKDDIEYLENKVSQLKGVMALKERLEPIDEKRRLEWEAKNQKEIAAEWWAEDVGIPEAVASIEATGRASKALASLVKIWQSKQSDKVKAAIENESPVSAAAVDAYKITLPSGYEKQGELYVFAGNKSESKPAESNEKPSQVTETAPKSTRVVFWVCPKGCCGAVAWSDDKTDATCQVCGVRKSDNAPIPATEARPS